MKASKNMDFDYGQEGFESQDMENRRYRLKQREPAMLMPEEKLARMGVVYYSNDEELPEQSNEKVVANKSDTPTQTITISKSQNDDKTKKSNLIYVITAAIVGYFAYNQME